MRPAATTALVALLLLGAGPAATTSAAGAPPSPPPAAAQGGGGPGDAPRLTTGVYRDLLREPETLWYAVEAWPGQEVGAVVVIRGRDDGPVTQRSALTVEVLDGARQAVGEPATVPFDGVADARAEVGAAPLSRAADTGVAYLTLTLASPEGANDLRDVGYQVEFLLEVTGEPAPTQEPSPAAPQSFAPPPSPPPAAPRAPQLGDVLPLALFAFAAGGALGFEAMRKRLRSHR